VSKICSFQCEQYLLTSASAAELNTLTFPHPTPMTRAAEVGKSCPLLK
jgi:hypothetical protein